MHGTEGSKHIGPLEFKIHITMKNIQSYSQRLEESGISRPWDRANEYLVGEDFSQLDLTDYDFESSNLTGANFQDANLVRTVFNYANMEGANLSYAIADAASFRSTNLKEAIFIETDIENAEFILANLKNSKGLETCTGIHKADFRGANMEGISQEFFEKVLSIKNDLSLWDGETNKWSSATIPEFFKDTKGLPDIITEIIQRMKKGKSAFGM